MIGIIDYGAGNIMSMKNAIDRLTPSDESTIVKTPKELENLDAIILPGVGSFSYLSELGEIKDKLLEKIESGTPFLGVCLGLQWLFEKSEEELGTKGLELLKGEVKKFPKGLPIPQIGWNRIKVRKEIGILEGLDRKYFYFVHSYYVSPEEKEYVAATTNYGIEFSSVVIRDNIYAMQFHPEKSGKNGLKLLENFLRVMKC